MCSIHTLCGVVKVVWGEVRKRSATFRGRSSFRADEGRKGWSLLAMKMKARTVVGTGEKSLLSDPRSELGLGREKGKEKHEESNRWDEPKTKLKRGP